MNSLCSGRHVQRVRHELHRRDVQVACTQPLGPNFLSITFNGEESNGFVSESFDDHVKFMFRDDSGEVVHSARRCRKLMPSAALSVLSITLPD